MSVRSVDVQNAVARTQDAERIQRVQNDAAKTGQQAFAAELSRRAEEKSHQVTSPPRSEKAEIRDKREGQGRGSRGEPEGKARKARGSDDRVMANADDGDAGQSSEAGQGEPTSRGKIIDVEV